MNQRLHARLGKLERAGAVQRAWPALLAGASVTEEIREWLKADGIAQAPTESLAETFARALGITPVELRRRLWQAAYGQ